MLTAPLLTAAAALGAVLAAGVLGLGVAAGRRRRCLACPTCGGAPDAVRLVGIGPGWPVTVRARCDACGAFAEVVGGRTRPVGGGEP